MDFLMNTKLQRIVCKAMPTALSQDSTDSPLLCALQAPIATFSQPFWCCTQNIWRGLCPGPQYSGSIVRAMLGLLLLCSRGLVHMTFSSK